MPLFNSRTAKVAVAGSLLAAAAVIALAFCARLAYAQAPAPAFEPKRLPTASGEVVLRTAMDVEFHEKWSFAASRRAGDLVFLSGVVAGPRPGVEPTVAEYQDGVRRAFRHLERSLKAHGLTFADVAMLNTFHVFQTPHFPGTKMEQFDAFLKVKNEFMSAPHTAWTAVGVTELLPDNGVVEIQAIAVVPKR